MAGDPRVSVIIVSYNSSATLPECFAGLARQTLRDFNVVLIDNKSDERPDRFIEGLPFSVQYLEMDDNLGFAEGMNQGIAASRAPLIVALNPDAYAEPTWLETLVAAADRHPEIAAFGSLQLRATDPGRIDGFGDHYLITGQAWRGETLPPPIDGPAYTFGVCAAAALYRSDVLRAIGGFDRRYFCFYEDVDLAFRLRLMGHHCAVIREAVVKHVGGASFEGKSDFAEFLIARNAWWTLLKNMPALLLPIAALGFLAINLISAVRGRSPARRRGFWEGLKQTGTFWAARREVQGRRVISSAEMAQWLTWSPGAFLRKVSITRPRSVPSRR
jgi:GT2 family glycosyltransferase